MGSRGLTMASDPQDLSGRRILLVEDDPALAMGLVDALEFEGLTVVHTKTGAEAQQLHARPGARFHCVILDVMLPDTNGYRLCEQMRERDETVPILMLTARSQEADKIRGLDAGADDYVTKPFSIGELVARIRAVLRRTVRAHDGDKPFAVGKSTVEPVAQVLVRGRDRIKLTFYEVALLRYLHERGGAVASREEILERVWGIGAGAQATRTVDNLVVKLRKKLEPNPDEPVHILTVYGHGYKLVG
jgi:DNA-binding response OmpR family regulator